MTIRTTFATLLAVSLSGMAFAQDETVEEAPVSTEAEPLTAQTVVASVNGTDITLGEMIITRAQLPAQYQQLPPEVLFEGILEQLVNQQLLADQLEDDPLRVTMALSNEARSLRAGEVINDLSMEAVTEEALQEAYDVMFEEMEPAREFNASHILVETEEEAAEIKTLLDDGADFAAMAQEHSTGPSGPNGGQLGWFGEGMMVEPFEAAVLDMEVGQISDPVQTQFGWHLIILNETRLQEAPPLDALRDELAAELQQQAITNRIAELTEAGDITLPADGAFAPDVLLNVDLLED